MITSRDPRDRVSRAVTSGRVLSVATSVSPQFLPREACEASWRVSCVRRCMPMFCFWG